MARQAPAIPTPEQCSDKTRVPIPGEPNTIAHAVWWPQMGGYVGRAVITVGSCSTLWLWHDGEFPHNDKPPREIHLCDYDQWIELFEWLQSRYDEEFNDGPQPYVWSLPEGVDLEEAEEAYRKAVEWGLWEVDPGGFEIRPWNDPRSHRPCTPVPCPPLVEADFSHGFEATPLLRAVLSSPLAFPAGLPRISVQQVLLEDAAKPPQVLYRGGPMPRDVQGLLERWITNPEWDADNAPLLVGVPEDMAPVELASAIALCQQAGLFPATPNGVLYLPAGMEE